MFFERKKNLLEYKNNCKTIICFSNLVFNGGVHAIIKCIECRMTGPGAEYGGNVNVTKSGYACSKWSEVHEDPFTADSKFPDGGRSAAGNRCRNPTGDPGGPWCYASVDSATVPDYCETSGCDDGVCYWTLINGGESSVHGHYTVIPPSEGDDGGGLVSFELKIWDPAAVRSVVKSFFRMSLTAYPTGLSGDGFEVPVPIDVFVRFGVASVARVDVSWRNGFVVLTAGKPGDAREVFTLELNATLTPVTYLSFTGDHSVAVRFADCDWRTAGMSYIRTFAAVAFDACTLHCFSKLTVSKIRFKYFLMI